MEKPYWLPEDEPDKETLLVEYQKAQDAALHHDNVVWTVSGMIIGAMLILFGLVLNNLPKINVYWVIFTGALGMVLTVFLGVCQDISRNVKLQKYDRCKQIEGYLKMKQHIQLECPKGIQTAWLISILGIFYLMWECVVLFLWEYGCSAVK